MRLSTRILLGFLLVLVLSLIDSGSNYLLSLKVERNSEFLNKSQEVIRNSANLNKTILDMQSSQRGYLLSRDSNFLQGYKQGLVIVPEILREQQRLVANNKTQLAILDSVMSLHMQWIGFANGLIAALENNEDSGETYSTLFENQFKRQVGKKLNDRIAQKLLEFDRIEYAIRNVHSSNLIKSMRSTHLFSLIFLALTIIIGIATTYYVVSLIGGRIKQMVNLADNISKGRFITVTDYSKDELTDLITSLNIMSVNLEKNIQELENRNAELNKFAYVVSHDLKAPIRGIHNVIQWIEEDMSKEISPEMAKYINIISGRTKRMENLINGLLDYARLREKTTPENIDTNALVEEITEDIVPGNFEVEFHDMPVIFGERVKIEQVFTNLISNSVKYTTEEFGKIIISCRTFTDHYEFSVKDNGIGIDTEFHGKIFEMFQTLREKGEKESTGIGLAIVKKIIEEQKGQIVVNSEIGKGTEFLFTWPKIKQQ